MQVRAAAAALIVGCTPGGEVVSSFSASHAAAEAPGDSSSGSSSTGSSSGSSGSSGSGSGSGSSSSDSSSGEAGSTGDTTMLPDFGEPGPVGCQGKIDFLFVISDSLAMEPYQERLIAAFPKFYKTIADEFPEFDAHILVTPATPGWGDYHCTDCLWCSNCTCEAGGPDYPCGSGPKLSECDTQGGSGVVFPAGPGATNHPCELGGGHRYITSETPDPAAAFACIAQLGTPDITTRVIDTMFDALGDGINSDIGCNAGFLRDDALLVVTLINTYGDIASWGTPFTWDWMLREIKNYEPGAFVVLAVEKDDYLADGICKPYVEGSPHRLHEFADEVAFSVKGSICASDYEPMFAEAAALALQQCELLVPG